MAANTPLRRYKQNTHGGGIRDPLVHGLADKGIAARGELRHQFCHASDLVPTLLDVVGIKPPAAINGVDADAARRRQLRARACKNAKAPVEGQAAVFRDVRPSRPGAGRLEGGRLPSAGHAASTNDKWELYHLDQDFTETNDLAEKEPERLKAMIDEWWREAEAQQGAAARRPLRAALRRQCQALPRAAQPLRVPCRHGPCADRRGARRAQPQLHDRGRRRRSTGR